MQNNNAERAGIFQIDRFKAGQPRNLASILAGQEFSPDHLDCLQVPPILVKQPRWEADHSHQSSAEVMNA
jgi:hypothetical protein